MKIRHHPSATPSTPSPSKIRHHQRFAQANPYHPRAKLFKHISHISESKISATLR